MSTDAGAEREQRLRPICAVVGACAMAGCASPAVDSTDTQARIDEILATGLHAYLTQFLDRVNELGMSISKDFLVPTN